MAKWLAVLPPGRCTTDRETLSRTAAFLIDRCAVRRTSASATAARGRPRRPQRRARERGQLVPVPRSEHAQTPPARPLTACRSAAWPLILRGGLGRAFEAGVADDRKHEGRLAVSRAPVLGPAQPFPRRQPGQSRCVFAIDGGKHPIARHVFVSAADEINTVLARAARACSDCSPTPATQ